MSDIQNTSVDTTDENCNCNCCANTDGRNVVNVCSSGNTLYIGCMPPAAACAENTADDTAPADNTNA